MHDKVNLNCNSFILALADDNHMDNLVAISLATEVIVSKLHNACRLRKQMYQFHSSMLFKRPRWSTAARSGAN